MQESKIISTIRDLSPKHRKSFRQFINSAFFNKHEKTGEIISFILDQIELGAENLDRTVLYSALFPNKAFDEQKFFNLMSYVKRQFNRFLAYQYLAEKEIEEELLSLEAAAYFGHEDLLTNRAQQFNKTLQNQSIKDSKNSFYEFRLNYLLSFIDFDTYEKSKPIMHQKMVG